MGRCYRRRLGAPSRLREVSQSTAVPAPSTPRAANIAAKGTRHAGRFHRIHSPSGASSGLGIRSAKAKYATVATFDPRQAYTAARKITVSSLGLIMSAASIWLLLSATDPRALHDTLAGADWRLVVGAVVTLALSMLVRTMRRKVILPPSHGRRATVRALFRVVLIGYAVNALVPARLGDVFRGVAASRRFRTGTPEALGSVGLERILDAGALAAVAAFASIGSQVPPWLTQGGLLIAVVAAAAVTFVYLIEIVRRFRPRASNGIQSLVGRAWSGLRASPRTIAASSLLCAVAWGIDGITVWMVARALGIDIGWEMSMLIAAGAAIAAILPSAPASIGTFHLGGTAVGIAMGMDASAALSLVVAWHALTFVSLLVPGTVSALVIGASRRDFARAGSRTTIRQAPAPTVPEASP